MPRCRKYIAQPFWRRGARLVAGEPHGFLCATDAEEGGGILLRQAAGVVVYQQVTDDEAQIYEEPEILAVLGEVPRDALAIDGDGREPWMDDVA